MSFKKPRGKEPKESEGKPGAKDQMNFTDPASRIMPCGGQTHFEQAYNAQAGVEIKSRLIVTNRVSQPPNNKQELVENVSVCTHFHIGLTSIGRVRQYDTSIFNKFFRDILCAHICPPNIVMRSNQINWETTKENEKRD